MVEDKKTTLYNFGLYVILIVILSAVAIALLRLFQIGVSVSYVIKISLPKIIVGIKLLIAPTLAFLGAMITDPDGCERYYYRMYNESLKRSTTDYPEKAKVKNIELLEYITSKNHLFSIISFSLTLLSSIVALSNIVNNGNINITHDSIMVPITIVVVLTVVLLIFKKIMSCDFYKKMKV